MIIMKFGGTSLKDADAFLNVVSIIKKHLQKKPIVVVSAISGITNLLEKAINEAAKQESENLTATTDGLQSRHLEIIDCLFANDALSQELKDRVISEIKNLRTLLVAMRTIKTEKSHLGHAILSIGEILSSLILARLLNQENIKTQFVDARKIMITSDAHDNVVPLPEIIRNESKKEIIPLVKKGITIVTQGFVGATPDGVPTTLGRNGSDFSASLIGAALNAEEIQIWTDVDGILTADPSIIPSAQLLETMTFDEASELAYFGARVLYPASIQPALEKGIPVRVLNSHFPDSAGTLILDKPNQEAGKLVKSIAYKEGISLLTITSSQLLLSTKLMADFFTFLNEQNVPVYAISKSATKLSLTIENNDDITSIVKKLNSFGETHVEFNKAIVSIVGESLKGNSEIAWQIIKMIKENNIEIDLISQFSLQISFMFIINEKDIEKTVRLIHKKFI